MTGTTNQKLATVTNLSIQRKRLQELSYFFGDEWFKQWNISVKPATLHEFEFFVIYTTNMDLDTIYGLIAEGFMIVQIKRESNAYQIVVVKRAEEKGNLNKFLSRKDRRLMMDKILDLYCPVNEEIAGADKSFLLI